MLSRPSNAERLDALEPRIEALERRREETPPDVARIDAELSEIKRRVTKVEGDVEAIESEQHATDVRTVGLTARVVTRSQAPGLVEEHLRLAALEGTHEWRTKWRERVEKIAVAVALLAAGGVAKTLWDLFATWWTGPKF